MYLGIFSCRVREQSIGIKCQLERNEVCQKPADKISFLKWNLNNILSIVVLRVSVKQAKQELEKSREKIHNWKESGNEIPFAGQFNRKIINT